MRRRKTVGRLTSTPYVRRFAAMVLAAITTIAHAPLAAVADESGKSRWLPGIYGSLAAAPLQPGWALATFNYYTSWMQAARLEVRFKSHAGG